MDFRYCSLDIVASFMTRKTYTSLALLNLGLCYVMLCVCDQVGNVGM